MTERHLVLHIGFPKTATTTLQRSLFRHDAAVAYIGKLGLHRGVSLGDLEARRSVEAHRLGNELARDLLWCSPQRWSQGEAGLVRRLLQASDEAGLTWDPLVLSNEDIIGSTSGAFAPIWYAGQRRLVGVDPDALAERIGAFADAAWPGRVSILVTLRRQDTFLASFFAQTFAQRWYAFDSSFERFADAVTADQYYSLGGVALDYDWLIGRLQQAVGRDHVHVLVYEDMATGPGEVARQLHDVTGTTIERAQAALGGSNWMVRATDRSRWRVQRFKGRNPLRRMRQWLHRRLRAGPDPHWAELTEAMSARVMARYAHSNRRLAERLGRSLADYGYYDE